jgi:hypothetical protein
MAEHLARPAEAAPTRHSQPWLHQHGKETQAFGTVRQFPLALAYETRMYSCQRLNQLLADTQIFYALGDCPSCTSRSTNRRAAGAGGHHRRAGADPRRHRVSRGTWQSHQGNRPRWLQGCGVRSPGARAQLILSARMMRRPASRLPAMTTNPRLRHLGRANSGMVPREHLATPRSSWARARR